MKYEIRTIGHFMPDGSFNGQIYRFKATYGHSARDNALAFFHHAAELTARRGDPMPCSRHVASSLKKLYELLPETRGGHWLPLRETSEFGCEKLDY